MSNYKLRFFFNNELISEESYCKIINPVFTFRSLDDNIVSFNVINEDDIMDFEKLDVYNLRIGIRND
jgi:hypothetical protein